MVAWAGLALLLVASDAPAWVRVPVVATFSVAGVGIALAVVLRLSWDALGVSVALGAGFASLIVCSMIPLNVFRFSSLASLALQALVVWALAAWVLRGSLKAVSR